MKKIAAILSFLVIAIAFTNCDNEIKPAYAEIKVVTSAGPIENADVRLKCTVTNCIIDTVRKSNKEGVATFQFDLPMVLKVEATAKVTTTQDVGTPTNPQIITVVKDFCGESFVTLDNGVVAQETVTMTECIP